VALFHKRDVLLNARNCADEVTMQFIDISKYDGRVLPALRDHFRKIVIPQIGKYDQWGPLKENKQGVRQIEAFRRTLRDFESYLNSAQMNIDGAVKLIDSENPKVNNIDPAESEELAKDPEFVKEVESIVQEWAKQIEQVTLYR